MIHNPLYKNLLKNTFTGAQANTFTGAQATTFPKENSSIMILP